VKRWFEKPCLYAAGVSAVDDRLVELAARWGLPPEGPRQLTAILSMVAEEPTSITTVRDPAAGVDAHVADSLAGLEVPALRAARTIADLGSGGGFPGLALAVALPGARVTLVESVGKKCEFLRRAAEEAGLVNVEVVNARAEAWPAGLGTQDVVTARALAPLNVLAEYAAPLLVAGGSLVAWKGKVDPSEAADGVAAATMLGLEAEPARAVEPFSGADHRWLYVYSKVSSTPARYPRREGMARKRPLRG
jgi:16S rRNA (guanine527-N7)-methyltransferase